MGRGLRVGGDLPWKGWLTREADREIEVELEVAVDLGVVLVHGECGF